MGRTATRAMAAPSEVLSEFYGKASADNYRVLLRPRILSPESGRETIVSPAAIFLGEGSTPSIDPFVSNPFRVDSLDAKKKLYAAYLKAKAMAESRYTGNKAYVNWRVYVGSESDSVVKHAMLFGRSLYRGHIGIAPPGYKTCAGFAEHLSDLRRCNRADLLRCAKNLHDIFRTVYKEDYFVLGRKTGNSELPRVAMLGLYQTGKTGVTTGFYITPDGHLTRDVMMAARSHELSHMNAKRELFGKDTKLGEAIREKFGPLLDETTLDISVGRLITANIGGCVEYSLIRQADLMDMLGGPETHPFTGAHGLETLLCNIYATKRPEEVGGTVKRLMDDGAESFRRVIESSLKTAYSVKNNDDYDDEDYGDVDDREDDEDDDDDEEFTPKAKSGAVSKAVLPPPLTAEQFTRNMRLDAEAFVVMKVAERYAAGAPSALGTRVLRKEELDQYAKSLRSAEEGGTKERTYEFFAKGNFGG